MKNLRKKLSLLFVVCCLFGAFFALQSYAASAESFYYQAEPNEPGTKIGLEQGLDKKDYLFLPATADYEKMTFVYDTELYSSVSLLLGDAEIPLKSGEAVNLSAFINGENDEHDASLFARTQDGVLNVIDFVMMRSSALRTMYYTSKDPEKYGRDYVDAAKSNELATGSLLLIDTDGTVDFSGAVKQLKGRGNTTFTKFAKKPYQIKLDKKTELVDGAGKSKKWILLANAADPSLIRNAITLFAGEQLGLEYNCKYESIDFYFDGEYRGTYLLTEKVEIGDGRIEISKTDDLIEEANVGNPAYDKPVTDTVAFADGKTPLVGDDAGSVRYVTGLNEPEFPKNCSHHAYLLEFELEGRYPDELTGFVTDRRQRIVTKTPEYLTRQQGLFIASYWQEFENAVYSADGYNAATGKYYYEYCDLDSLAKCYILNEFNKNCDYYGSSTFFYLPENSDIFICGPLWDYDLAYGIGYDLNRDSDITKPEYFYCGDYPFAKALLRIQSFRDKVKELALPGGEAYEAMQAMVGESGVIAQYAANVFDSQKMNYKLWDIANCAMPAVSQVTDLNYETAVRDLDAFVSARLAWISSRIAEWEGDSYFVQTKSDAETIKELLEAFLRVMQQFVDTIQKLLSLNTLLPL